MSIASSDATITGTASDSDSVSRSRSSSLEPNAAPLKQSELIDYEDYSNFSPAFTRDSFSLEEVHNLRLLIQDELSCFARRATSAGDSNRIERLRLYSRIDDLFSLVSR
jgi:hypothetical protein